MRSPLPKTRALAGLFAVLLTLGGCTSDHVERGDRLARERRWKEAVEAYEQAIREYPHDYDAAWGIARIYCFEMHMADKCVTWTERLLLAYPKRAEYRRAAAQGWRDRARAAEARGDRTGAQEARKRAEALEQTP